jgi:hypothetical protein
MMADRGYGRQKQSRSFWRGGSGPKQCVGPIGAVTAAQTMAILNKSGKNLKECYCMKDCSLE